MVRLDTLIDAGLIRVARSVFEPLDLEVELPRHVPHGEEDWMSSVRLSGGFEGRVEVYAGNVLMDAVCGLMLGRLPDSLSDSEREDAWGEIANLIAGFVLQDLPEPTALAHPQVARAVRPERPEGLLRCGHALVEGEPISILLLQN
ncbi:MAG: chemotaxis protein CheX [Myxococcota bacterium]